MNRSATGTEVEERLEVEFIPGSPGGPTQTPRSGPAKPKRRVSRSFPARAAPGPPGPEIRGCAVREAAARQREGRSGQFRERGASADLLLQKVQEQFLALLGHLVADFRVLAAGARLR